MLLRNAEGALFAGGLAAIGASLCCVAPLVLLMLGIGGAWIANLTALEPYSPFFAGVALLSFGFAFRKLYVAPQSCAEGRICADPRALKRRRATFWIVAVPSLGLLAAPWLGPIFY